MVLAGTIKRADEIALGLALRGYTFDTHKTAAKKPAARKKTERKKSGRKKASKKTPEDAG